MASRQLSPTRLSRWRPLVEPLEARTVPDGLSLVANWNHEGDAHYYSDLWAEGNFVYLGHIIDQLGVDIIDISDPSNPRLASVFRGTGGDNDIRDLHVQNGIGFFASDTDGSVYVVDVSDPYNPRQLTRISAAIGGAKNVHTLSVSGDYLYEADSRTADIYVFNISDPRSPRFVRTITTPSPGPVHEVTALGGWLYTALISSPGFVDVFDINDVEVAAPLLGSFATGNVAHTTWPILDGGYLAVAREEQGGDVEIWDIRDLANPVRLSRIGLPLTEAFSAHQVMSVGSWLYVSWYQAGVRVYEIADPAAPVLVADYDTYPYKVEGFNGSWGVFPYLGADRILASDIGTGLYILAHTSGPGSPSGEGPRRPRSVERPGLLPIHSSHGTLVDPQPALAGVAHHLGTLLAPAGPRHILLGAEHSGRWLMTDHGSMASDSRFHLLEPVEASRREHGLARAPLWHKPG